jgi:hypothetical protein
MAKEPMMIGMEEVIRFEMILHFMDNIFNDFTKLYNVKNWTKIITIHGVTFLMKREYQLNL